MACMSWSWLALWFGIIAGCWDRISFNLYCFLSESDSLNLMEVVLHMLLSASPKP